MTSTARAKPKAAASPASAARRKAEPAAGEISLLPEDIKPDPEASARAAGLRYVSDEAPGIRRRKSGKGFSYIGPDGKAVRDRATLERIRSRKMPPAYRDVWFCTLASGHMQATGVDERGRKQYRYHARWREVRDEAKYARMIAFGQALPLIRERTQSDLKKPNMPREKVLAGLVQLLEKTAIRIGNEEYARANESYGLSTLRNRHVDVEGTRVRFEFKGKSGKSHRIDLHDRRLARLVGKLQELPGQELFQYVDADGVPHSIGSGDVNDYLHEITGQPFSAKDFRTWTGTLLAALALRELEAFGTEAQARQNVVAAIESVSKKLGNTPSICRKCYVHPAILESYLDGSLLESLEQQAQAELSDELSKLKPEEAAVMALLQKRLAQASS